MKKVNISKIKAELSKFINLVKQGEEIVILDRDRPVAMLTGIQEFQDFIILDAESSESSAKAFFRTLDQHQLNQDTNIMEVLSAERGDRF